MENTLTKKLAAIQAAKEGIEEIKNRIIELTKGITVIHVIDENTGFVHSIVEEKNKNVLSRIKSRVMQDRLAKKIDPDNFDEEAAYVSIYEDIVTHGILVEKITELDIIKSINNRLKILELIEDMQTLQDKITEIESMFDPEEIKIMKLSDATKEINELASKYKRA